MEIFFGIIVMLITLAIIYFIGKAWNAVPELHKDMRMNIFDGTGFSAKKIIPFIFFALLSFVFLVIIIATIGSVLSVANSAKDWLKD